MLALPRIDSSPGMYTCMKLPGWPEANTIENHFCCSGDKDTWAAFSWHQGVLSALQGVKAENSLVLAVFLKILLLGSSGSIVAARLAQTGTHPSFNWMHSKCKDETCAVSEHFLSVVNDSTVFRLCVHEAHSVYVIHTAPSLLDMNAA